MERIVVIYVLGTAVALTATVFLIILFLRHQFDILLTLVTIFMPYVFLGMVKIRCRFDAPFPCGWMSFTYGVTWHVLISAVFVGLAAFTIHRLGLTEAVKPLSGGWIALFWSVLPVTVIHPPSHGGPCPYIPLVCHDLPLFSLGGLFYWLLPFVVWSTIRVVIRLFSLRSVLPLRNNSH